MVKSRIMHTMLYDSPGTLVSRCQRSWRNSNGVTQNRGPKQRWGSFRSAIFDQYIATSQKWYKIET